MSYLSTYLLTYFYQIVKMTTTTTTTGKIYKKILLSLDEFLKLHRQIIIDFFFFSKDFLKDELSIRDRLVMIIMERLLPGHFLSH